MDDKSKKHHYVPQSMLRRFSSDTAQLKIHVFDKKYSKTFPSPIKDAGCENHFNTVEIEGKVIPFERVFQDNDEQVARLLDKITGDRSVSALTPEDRLALSEVVAVQFARTKIRRTTPQDIAKQVSESIVAAGFGTKGLPIPTAEQLKLAALLSLGRLDRIVENLQNKRLVLVARYDTNPFWISGNPVVM